MVGGVFIWFKEDREVELWRRLKPVEVGTIYFWSFDFVTIEERGYSGDLL